MSGNRVKPSFYLEDPMERVGLRVCYDDPVIRRENVDWERVRSAVIEYMVLESGTIVCSRVVYRTWIIGGPRSAEWPRYDHESVLELSNIA
ncbi:unnamed protein product [Microthlaspi erraticum]|uniref:Uncharacterized protein n=1 Tax=Microthlaspi erraticum TaxID=1685480 RepID=A0A6D2HK90_9BRAS|nr:unnamed protein product [Microthlaspi erraticum]